MNHSVGVLLIVVTVVMVLLGVAAHYYSNQRRTKLLRRHFGPEYDRVVRQKRNVRQAEGVLEFREKAREALQIRPLPRSDQIAYARRWNEVQRQFVDDPQQALMQADRMLNDVMAARGYPVLNFEEQAEIVSVDYPVLVQHYRMAHEITLRRNTGRSSTEELRKAVVHYRSLFDELLKDSLIDRKEARE